ncbi:hypothetical protein LXL04_024743 [Taraxacum kok-saghyz]
MFSVVLRTRFNEEADRTGMTPPNQSITLEVLWLSRFGGSFLALLDDFALLRVAVLLCGVWWLFFGISGRICPSAGGCLVFWFRAAAAAVVFGFVLLLARNF